MAARTRSQGSSLRSGTGRVCLEHNSNLSSRDDQAGLRVLAAFVGLEALELTASPTAAHLAIALPHRRE